MIRVEVTAPGDKSVCSVYMNTAPQVGELLWLTGIARDRAQEKFCTSSFTVTEIAHWVHPGGSEAIHSICAFVVPVIK